MKRHSPRIRSGSVDVRRGQQHGWTLIEMLTVIIILAVVTAVGARLMSSMFRSYFTARDITNSDAQARVAFERMTRELRQIRSATATDLDVASAAQVRFIDTDGNGVCFYRDAATNRLMRSADGPATACGTTSAQPLSDFVTGLIFAYYLNDGRTTTSVPTSVYYVTVHVDLQDNDVSDTLRATIHPRNF
ncbi:MAG: prepilin-type N-terminal cleavage/methylation domain-containing protein [Betaproteobacteria bacterium]|nr:MAG: prepilin-type N-terminal cleavage/methylation domain-containing protein [Betaproteobacteria bacterium]TMH82474.1 MAG: prepilin-type N-terminal cleavage/methylation domain-containing protein [Betaproteobacteria bacterium]